jgi:hypothetical protein
LSTPPPTHTKKILIWHSKAQNASSLLSH